MKKIVVLSLAFLVAVGLMLTPVISSAVPGHGNGNGNPGGNGNHYGWGNGNGNDNHQGWGNGDGNGGSTADVPEPSTLLVLVSSLAGLGGWVAIRRRMR